MVGKIYYRQVVLLNFLTVILFVILLTLNSAAYFDYHMNLCKMAFVVKSIEDDKGSQQWKRCVKGSENTARGGGGDSGAVAGHRAKLLR